jgi:hypothetical protein
VTNSPRAKGFMLVVHIGAVIAGLYGGAWLFDAFT